MMKPFFAFAEMVQLAPVRETKDIGSPIVKLWVRDVLPTSPAYKAGLRKGMFIIQIQDLDVRGKTEKELHLETGKLSVVKDINVIVTPSLTSEKEISFSIPIPQSRREVIARN
ncbi:MAG TPA: PDZ domain-containing protein [Candidatus Paceibacterota bacterium]|jgi:Periplasmic protease